ncbi:MAG TPA: hypothetical protein VL860_12160 [Planctomycetota bacterium]|nr:hypothetical protein [Planctomycetota bacterium]
MDTFHNSPMFKGLAPKDFCRKLFDVYYDGRRKSWDDFNKGLTLWAHTGQEPHANDGIIELDPVLLLNVYGTGYCGIQSGLLEGIYQSRPGGTPGKPAIEARRWFLAGIVHSVCDAYYDGGWHYYDIDIGGYAGDAQKDVWSVADMMADPKAYYTTTTLRAPYFFKADGNGHWVEKVEKAKSYAFQDDLMLGHEMAFTLRKGEKFTRYFSEKDAGWKETLPSTKATELAQKGYCELIYEPTPADLAAEALSTAGGATILAVRCPYNISSSKVEPAAGAKASVSYDIGKTWTPLPDDGLVAGAVNHWDYLLKLEGGGLKKITTRGVLHPGALPRVNDVTTMTVTKSADYQVLTWIPDWHDQASCAATGTAQGLSYAASGAMSFSGGELGGSGSVTIPVHAPPGCKIVKLAACVMGGTGTDPQPDKYLELAIGPAGKSAVVARSTDCSPWGHKPESKVDQWQNNVSGTASFPATLDAEIKVNIKQGRTLGLRIYVGYVQDKPAPATGTLTITHGIDGKPFAQQVPVATLEITPFTYKTPAGKVNNYVTMEVK